ncbi:MAG: hypothetical protein WD049_00440 [Candidatus Paceibacterota bacterium]
MRSKPIAGGPGTALLKLIADQGGTVHRGGVCNDKIRQMNLWGSEGCRERLNVIVGWLTAPPRRTNRRERITVTAPGSRRPSPGTARRLVLNAIARHEGDVNHGNLIIVVVGGKTTEEQWQITGPRIENYARRVGADLKVLMGDHHPGWPMANKWRIQPFVAKYERTLYLDVDVFISPDAPNIFDAVPKNRFGLFDEFADTRFNVPGNWIQKEGNAICDSQGWPRIQLTWSANGGVLLFPKWASDLYAPPEKKVKKYWCLDQGLLTLQLERFQIQPHFLDRKWNHGFVGSQFWRGIKDAYFVHLNGSRPHSYRMALLRRFAAGDFSRLNPPATAHWRPQWASL